MTKIIVQTLKDKKKTDLKVLILAIIILILSVILAFRGLK